MRTVFCGFLASTTSTSPLINNNPSPQMYSQRTYTPCKIYQCMADFCGWSEKLPLPGTKKEERDI